MVSCIGIDNKCQFFEYPHPKATNSIQTVSAFALNVNQWGNLGRVPANHNGDFLDTKLNHEDKRRENTLGLSMSKLKEDFVCYTEMFDPLVGQRIWERNQQEFPYAIMSPAGRGIPGIIDVWRNKYPRLFKPFSDPHDLVAIVNSITSSHYQAGSLGEVLLSIAVKHYLSPTQANLLINVVTSISLLQTFPLSDVMEKSALSTFLNEDTRFHFLNTRLEGPFWGAGGMLASRHPLLKDETEFARHPVVADLEHFTQKGVLKTVARLPDGRKITIIVTHFQEGISPQANQAREAQAQQVKQMADRSPYPVLIIVDQNDEEGSAAHKILTRPISPDTISYKDIYRALHSDAGYTYDPTDNRNEIAKRKIGNSRVASEKPTRIDFGFTDLDPLKAIVRDYYDTTDHRGLHFVMGLEHYSQILAERQRKTHTPFFRI